MKTPEQHQTSRSCGFIVGFKQIMYIGFHAHLTYFRNSCFHCFEQVNAICQRHQKLKKYRCMVFVISLSFLPIPSSHPPPLVL